MMVDEVIEVFPEASEILLSYGLSCVGCYANAFESLEIGLLRHGYSEEEVEEIVSDLNGYFQNFHNNKKKKPSSKANKMKISVSKFAQKKIQEIAIEQDKQGQPLRVSAKYIGDTLTHSLDFISRDEIGKYDKEYSFVKGKVILVADKRDFDKLNGLKIDYIEEKNREGFKMNYPSAQKNARSKS